MAPRGRKAVNPLRSVNRADLLARVASLSTESSSTAAEPKLKEPTEDQNEHLAAYRSFLRFYNELSDNVTDDEVDVLGFPVEPNTLRELLCGFVFMLRDLALEEPIADDRVTDSELREYRDSMLFWADRFFERLHPGSAKPDNDHLQRWMDKAIRVPLDKLSGGSAQS